MQVSRVVKVHTPDITGLADGDVLVISSAMPGLVGAMLCSDSPIKALRNTITRVGGRADGTDDGVSGSEKETLHQQGFVKLKVFNTVLRDHLDHLVEYGVYRRSDDD